MSYNQYAQYPFSYSYPSEQMYPTTTSVHHSHVSCSCKFCRGRQTRMITRYLLAILFILLASSRHLVNRFIDMMRQYEMDEFTAEIIYSVGLVIVFSLFYYVISCARAPHSHSYQENFFFQVSENKTLGRNHPRDAITNANKSVSFQYDVPDGSGDRKSVV